MLLLLSLSLTNRYRLILGTVTLSSEGIDTERALLDRGQSCSQCVFRGGGTTLSVGFPDVVLGDRVAVSITLSDGAVSDIAGQQITISAISLTTGATENNFDADNPGTISPFASTASNWLPFTLGSRSHRTYRDGH